VNVCPPTVRVPVRSRPELLATSNVTLPFPVPVAPFVTVSHGALAVAVHAQDGADAVTVIEPESPCFLASCEFGEIVMLHAGGGGGADCVIVKVFPAATMAADRVAVVVLAVTVNATVPLPVPDAPEVTAIHAAPVDDVHAQELAEAVTPNEPDPPGLLRFCETGEMANVHAGGAAACEIVNVWPATASVVVRALPLLADTR